MDHIIEMALNEFQPTEVSHDIDHRKYLILQEPLKTMMTQISPLKALYCGSRFSRTIKGLPFTYFPGAKDFLTGLSVFGCDSNLYSEFFHQFSQVCHNVRSLTITFQNTLVSNGLKKFVSSQDRLNYLRLDLSELDYKNWMDIIPALTKHSNTLTNLCILIENDWRLSFIASFVNLQEFILCYFHLMNWKMSLYQTYKPWGCLLVHQRKRSW